jgi:hypothetical protein
VGAHTYIFVFTMFVVPAHCPLSTTTKLSLIMDDDNQRQNPLARILSGLTASLAHQQQQPHLPPPTDDDDTKREVVASLAVVFATGEDTTDILSRAICDQSAADSLFSQKGSYVDFSHFFNPNGGLVDDLFVMSVLGKIDPMESATNVPWNKFQSTVMNFMDESSQYPPPSVGYTSLQKTINLVGFMTDNPLVAKSWLEDTVSTTKKGILWSLMNITPLVWASEIVMNVIQGVDPKEQWVICRNAKAMIVDTYWNPLWLSIEEVFDSIVKSFPDKMLVWLYRITKYLSLYRTESARMNGLSENSFSLNIAKYVMHLNRTFPADDDQDPQDRWLKWSSLAWKWGDCLGMPPNTTFEDEEAHEADQANGTEGGDETDRAVEVMEGDETDRAVEVMEGDETDRAVEVTGEVVVHNDAQNDVQDGVQDGVQEEEQQGGGGGSQEIAEENINGILRMLMGIQNRATNILPPDVSSVPLSTLKEELFFLACMSLAGPDFCHNGLLNSFLRGQKSQKDTSAVIDIQFFEYWITSAILFEDTAWILEIHHFVGKLFEVLDRLTDQQLAQTPLELINTVTESAFFISATTEVSSASDWDTPLSVMTRILDLDSKYGVPRFVAIDIVHTMQNMVCGSHLNPKVCTTFLESMKNGGFGWMGSVIRVYNDIEELSEDAEKVHNRSHIRELFMCLFEHQHFADLFSENVCGTLVFSQFVNGLFNDISVFMDPISTYTDESRAALETHATLFRESSEGGEESFTQEYHDNEIKFGSIVVTVTRLTTCLKEMMKLFCVVVQHFGSSLTRDPLVGNERAPTVLVNYLFKMGALHELGIVYKDKVNKSSSIYRKLTILTKIGSKTVRKCLGTFEDMLNIDPCHSVYPFRHVWDLRIPQNATLFETILQWAAHEESSQGGTQGTAIKNTIMDKIRELDENKPSIDESEIPEHFLDSMMGGIMDSPVMFPLSGIVVDETTALRCLLNKKEDPFNREPCEPGDIVQMDSLKKEIHQWLLLNNRPKTRKHARKEEEDTSVTNDLGVTTTKRPRPPPQDEGLSPSHHKPCCGASGVDTGNMH